MARVVGYCREPDPAARMMPLKCLESGVKDELLILVTSNSHTIKMLYFLSYLKKDKKALYISEGSSCPQMYLNRGGDIQELPWEQLGLFSARGFSLITFIPAFNGTGRKVIKTPVILKIL